MCLLKWEPFLFISSTCLLYLFSPLFKFYHFSCYIGVCYLTTLAFLIPLLFKFFGFGDEKKCRRVLGMPVSEFCAQLPYFKLTILTQYFCKKSLWYFLFIPFCWLCYLYICKCMLYYIHCWLSHVHRRVYHLRPRLSEIMTLWSS